MLNKTKFPYLTLIESNLGLKWEYELDFIKHKRITQPGVKLKKISQLAIL
jgi:hypothetical protein